MYQNKFILAILFLFMTIGTANAQVTIGSTFAPKDGSILDLKQDEANNQNSTKGLGMPRVNLTSITDLFPMFLRGYDKLEHDLPHTGMIVYNVNENLPDGYGAGMYVWDGAKWIGLVIPKKIVANPNLIYISEIKPTGTTALTVSGSSSWTMSATSGPNSSTYSAVGNDVTFKSVDGTYGDKTYTFSIQNSDNQVNVVVKHLHLSINNPVIKVGDNVTVSNASAVEALGGDASWVLVDYTVAGFNWIAPPVNAGGSLNFQLGAATAQNVDIEGTITVAHVNDPAYTKTIKIIQSSSFISLPEFDYLLLQYRFDPEISTVTDIDIVTTFNGTGVAAVDFKRIGYGIASNMTEEILNWPGDNRVTGFEATYAHMPMVLGLLGNDAPKVFNIDMYAHWYMKTEDYIRDLFNPGKNNITISITLYKGGKMDRTPGLYPANLDYLNIGGTQVFKLDVPNIPIITSGMVAAEGAAMFSEYWKNYTPAFRLEFDRVEKTGVIVRSFVPVIPTTRMSEPALLMLPYETKDGYAKRIEEANKIDSLTKE